MAIVLDNLIENALRYSPPGTEVTVRWRREGNRAELSVEDEGPGLAAGEEAHVFERFARGSAAHGASASGLGLPIVATLARRWGGTASIRNRAEGGAEARVELPAAPPGLCRALTESWTGLTGGRIGSKSMRKGYWSIVAIAALGLVLAGALAAFAHTIARSTVALPSTNLERTNERLAPAQARRPNPVAARRTSTGTTTTTTTGTGTTTDDDRGRNRRGRGSDD